MELEPQEQVIVDLLAKLKNANGGYPKKLMAFRRHIYLNQIANIGLGLGIGAGLKNTAKAPKSGASSLHISAVPAASSLFETLLVAAIIVEAGVAAYTYRDKLAELFISFSSTPKVEEVAPQSVVESPQPEIIVSGTLIATETPAVTSTITLTTTSTVEQPAGNDTTGKNIATATPTPNNDGNGNHYGQTSVPKATKENNNGSSDKSNNKP